MSKFIFKLSVLAMMLLFTMSQFSVQIQANESLEKTDHFKYAFDRTFPVEDGDDSILTNSFYEFKGYKNQGTMLINKENVDDFKLYINGHNISPALLGDKVRQKDGSYLIDISNFTSNQTNILQITGVRGDNPKLRIRIPFPIIKPDKLNIKKIDQNILNLLEDVIKAEIFEGSTGVQLVVLKDGEVAVNKAYGYINNYYPNGQPIPIKKRIKVTPNTLFDLASNTKMYTVNYAVQHLVYQKKISVNDPIIKFFPEFKDNQNDKVKGKNKLTIKDLLEHQGGFPADPKYFDETYDKDDGMINGKNDLFSQDREKTKEMILKTPLQYEPGTKTIYSDVDYMLLGLVVEKITGKNLDEYMKEEFYKPLNLDRITFNPLDHGFKTNEIAATELNGNSRDGLLSFRNNRVGTIQGTVHDEKAYYSMNGISGHAGLFSNAMQIATLAQLMLNEGGYATNYYWDKTTQDMFTKPKDTNSTYGLGWRRQADGRYSWEFSPMADSMTIGHTGWTGTLTVIDPKEQMIIVLLTNKKNSPVLNNQKNPNNFFGDRFLVNRYGMVTTLIYRSLSSATLDQTRELLNELVTEKEKLIETNPDVYKNPADEADLKALKKVQRDYKNKR